MAAGQPRPEGTVAGLADAIKALRAELNDAMVAGKDEALQFEVGTVTMDFSVELTADAEAKGGVRFWVIERGGAASVGRNASHMVHLELTPRTRGGSSPLIADDE